MKRISSLYILFFLFLQLKGQTPVGTWSDHLIYNRAKSVAAGDGEIYASTGSSILVYNKEYAELKKMSRINGLSETGISTIGWSEENKALIIAYTSTNIDIIRSGSVNNIPDIERKYIPGKKVINRIRCNGKYAYLACSFGIILVDIQKREIFDTWKPGITSESPEILDIAFSSTKIYAATAAGVYSAAISDPGLAYFGNWSLVSTLPYPSGKYTAACYSGNKLYVNYSSSGGDIVYSVDGSSSQFSSVPGVFNTSFDNYAGGFLISAASSVRQYNSSGALLKSISSYGWGTANISQAVIQNEDIWIADLSSGLVRGEKMTSFTKLTLPGPASDNGFSIHSSEGKTIICAGSVDVAWNNLGYPLQVSLFEDNKWSAISSSSIIDAMRSFVDPADRNHLYVTTWGGGLLEYIDNVLVKQYNEYNSPLQSIIPGKPYSRVCGLAIDKNKNIWLTQTQVPGSIKVLKPDGSWIVNPVTIDAPTIGDIIITQRGQKWVVLPRGFGLFVLDDKGTPEVFNDDLYRKMLVRDTENQVISGVFSIAEDLEGAIWVGTDQGPLVYYNPQDVFKEEIKASRPKVPRNDGTDIYDYLLKNETITAIAVDGANRKWLGTASSGAFHVSTDGSSLLQSFDELKSPILSNSIVSLAIDGKGGDVWFGTSKGIQSYRALATKGEESYSKVYSFPNPVREDFEGNVTITGLVRDTQIMITDVSGNLVYKTISQGGQAEWDLKTYNGKRVATGVYLVFCASIDGSQAAVTKMLVIN